MRYMLDTDTCSYVLKQKPIEVLKRFDQVEVGQLCVSVVTQAELLYGAERLQSKKLHHLIGRFLERLSIEPWSEEAATLYAKKRCELEKAGTPIGNMDLLIACHALSLSATLVTNNTKHFGKVSGLVIENWTHA